MYNKLMDLMGVILSGGKKAILKGHLRMSPFTQHFQNDKIIETGNRLVLCLKLRMIRVDMTIKG